jgi:uncharacterized protein
MHEPLGPVPGEDRVVLVDALRGFALLGILLVNMAYYAEPFTARLLGGSGGLGLLDTVAADVVHFLAEAKFYALFSLLFGFGLFTQMTRAEARSVPFKGRWARRLLILLLFGLIHGCLIWGGDILTTYALLGFPLLLYRRMSPRGLIAWSSSLIGGLVLIAAGAAALVGAALKSPESARQIEASMNAGSLATVAEQAQRVYGSGTFAEITALRVTDFASATGMMLFVFGPSVFAMFLLGIWVARKGLLREPAAHRRLLRRIFVPALIVGIAANGAVVAALHATLATEGFPAVDVLFYLVAMGALMLGGPAFCLVYLTGAALLSLRQGSARLIRALAPVGRMALSNYLLQSVVCTLIFYSYGLGLFGKVGPAWGFALAITIHAFQVIVSHAWMSRYNFGPVEWLWRTLTYGRRQPMRRSIPRYATSAA